SYSSAGSVFFHFVRQLEVGYDQLYFLIVIAEFYVAFPLVLWVLRKTRGHHTLLLGAALVLQVFFTIGVHWGWFGYRMGEYAQENAAFYVLYLMGGAVVACHLTEFHDWVMSHKLLIVYLTVATALLAEGVYFLTKGSGADALGHAADPFQPSVIPFNICVIALGYLAGMWLVHPHRHRWIRKATRIGSDDSYGIFLAQMLFVTALALWGGRDFADTMPFYVWIPLCIAFAYLGSIALTELLARTPLAVPLTGRKQVPWRAGRRPAGSHRRAAAAAVPATAGVPLSASVPAIDVSSDAPATADPTSAAVPAVAASLEPTRSSAPTPTPAARDRESTPLAAAASDQNGA
ncbi:MAG TPA: acyltransferase, partial [Streptosporangiaceae bacterium]